MLSGLCQIGSSGDTVADIARGADDQRRPLRATRLSTEALTGMFRSQLLNRRDEGRVAVDR